MKREFTVAHLAELTGLSQKQVIRFAKSAEIPNTKLVAGRGPGSGYRSNKSTALSKWVARRTVCEAVRGYRGRKGKLGYESLATTLSTCTNQIRYRQSWESVTTAISQLSKQLPKKIRKMMSLRGCSIEQVVSLKRAMMPIWELQNDVSLKLDRFNRGNQRW
jgi:hypothetical protein